MFRRMSKPPPGGMAYLDCILQPHMQSHPKLGGILANKNKKWTGLLYIKSTLLDIMIGGYST